jgi:lambda family phage portal protein
MQLRTTFLDRVVQHFFPRRGLRRIQARAELQFALDTVSERTFEGASRGTRMQGWNASGFSINGELRSQLPTLRNRTRDLVQNDTYGNNALRSLQNNIIGTGIVPRIKAKNEKDTQLLQDLWDSWADKITCAYDGRGTFYGLQSLATRAAAESGEILVRRRRPSAGDGLQVPLQLELLEPDHIDTWREGVVEGSATGNFIVQGVEFDSRGKRTAYHLFKQHPGDALWGLRNSLSPVRIDASEILHMFDTWRPGQVRGIPWFAPALVKFHDLSQYSDFNLQRQKIAAAFAGFVQDQEALDDLSSTSKKTKKLPDEIRSGALMKLPPGKTITFPNTPIPNGYQEVMRVDLRGAASGLGMPYEELTGDYSGVNFSSGRMGWLSYYRNINAWRWFMVIPFFCDPVFEWWREAAIVAGYPAEGAIATWTPPRRDMIDPVQESNAQIIQVRGGLKSRSEVIRENGDDPNKVVQEIADDNKKADELGLVLETDPRKTTKGGLVQPAGETSDGGNNNGKA